MAMIRFARLPVTVAASALVAACGGSNDSSSAGASDNPNTAGASYDFVAPTLNAQRNYTQTITDNFNNTIQETVSQTVTAVNPDGSYTSLQEDPNHDSVVVDGTTWSVLTESIDFDNNAQAVSYSYTNSKNAQVTCTYDPHGNGPDYPLVVGSTWSITYTVTCGSNAPITYTQSGTIVDVELVTVPAGTYTALNLQSTVNWTNAQGTNITQTITNWRDTVTQQPVKRITDSSYSGVLPANGYATSTVLELTGTS